MRFRLELEIDLPRDRVVALFLDPENLERWQPDFVSFEQISGQAREVGAVAKQIHTMGGREVETIETITVHDYPEKFAAIYESDGIWNLIENHFSSVGERRTGWVLESHCKGTGIVMMLMTIFLRGLFRKHARTYMRLFKEFAETSDR